MRQADRTPAYRNRASEEVHERADALWERYAACDCCPHACGVDRTNGEVGHCGIDDTARLASFGPHFGEEPPLVGSGGSGTIFLAGCPLSCVFCQNHHISQGLAGDPATPVEIADVALEVQERGCENLNFVTPSHVPGHLLRAIALAREQGLSIPIVWNCGGYESIDVLQSLDGIVDVYMPDVKFADDALATRYAGAPDYWDRAREALEEMHRQVGDLQIEDGIATGGLLVRHLFLPGHVENSKAVLEFVAEELSRETYLNLMAQYRPAYTVAGSSEYGELDRRPTPGKYESVVAYGRELGLNRLQVEKLY